MTITKDPLALKSSTHVLDALKAASKRTVSAQEILEQRVSFVYGSMKADNGVTKAQVKELIVQHDGGR